MKGNRAVLIAVVVVVVLVAAWFLVRRGGSGGGLDLVQQFDAAQKRPAAELFAVEDVTVGGESKKGISVKPTVGTRLTFKVRIPDDGWLSVAVGMKPESWTVEGDGVKFHVGVSDGRAYEPLFEQHVNPFANEGDRKWIPVMVDLSAYAGEEIDLIFNTNSSMPNQGDDQRGDMPVWGQPQIVVR